MPKQACVISEIEKSDDQSNTQFKMRMRARVNYTDAKGILQAKGDIYPEDYVEHAVFKGSALLCFETETLLDLFDKKFDSRLGYYFDEVRVDIKGADDCQLVGDDAVYLKLETPVEGTSYNTVRLRKAFPLIECKPSPDETVKSTE